jgi:hypothetical protein
MLSIGPPVLLDIKPPSLLTAGERRRFAEGLGEPGLDTLHVDFSEPINQNLVWQPL